MVHFFNPFYKNSDLIGSPALRHSPESCLSENDGSIRLLPIVGPPSHVCGLVWPLKQTGLFPAAGNPLRSLDLSAIAVRIMRR